MNIYENPARSEWEAICRRPSDSNPVVRERVTAIIDRVRADGDKALRELAEEIDGRCPESIRVSDRAVREACRLVSPDVRDAIKAAMGNIGKFHKKQLPKEIKVRTAPGVTCIQRPVPISRVGLYIPGGTAPLFSTVLMLAVPAKLAGCGEVVLCTPAGKNGKIAPEVLYAAKCCGIKKIYEVGGAQAIAAMAFGTESVDKVDKIFGPGNQYVTTAKQILGGSVVAIDMPAGPSEVMVIADSEADPEFVAADLLSQAEHGRDSQVVLVCDSRDFASGVEEQVKRQLRDLGRAEFAEAALEKSSFVIFRKTADMVDFANEYAPEHLIVSTRKPYKIVDDITAAGSVFVGDFTPESAGDYASGTNHTLPTCAWARSYSGVNIDSFIRKMTIQEITREGLEGLSRTIVSMAEAEGLQAHANAVKVRINEK
ncbi:MAG: histidinol dehydrogenase [Bacteroidia bacterium]|nr:histidinol dehydrogenase [Bacteroidia bacterium]